MSGYDRDDRRPAAAPPDPAELADAMAQPVKFTHSPEIGELAAALALAQGQMANAGRAAENPGRKRADGTASRYADLAAAREAWHRPLADNGLALVQMPSACGPKMVLVTMLAHGKSGQWLRGDYPIDAPMADPQRIGSAITYARRYAAMALTGIAPEDDDGNAASDAARRGPARESRPAAGRERPARGAAAKSDMPAWKQLVAFRVREANDEWADLLERHQVPAEGRAELTNPSRCVNGVVTKWVDEGIFEESAVARDDDPKTRDRGKVGALMAAEHERNRELLDQDIRAYVRGRRDRAWQELGLPTAAGGAAS